MSNIRRVTVWYERADWDRLRPLCSDLEPTYDEWKFYVRRGLQRQGITEQDLEKVVLTPEILIAHGASVSSKVSSNDRVKIALKIAVEQDNETRH